MGDLGAPSDPRHGEVVRAPALGLAAGSWLMVLDFEERVQDLVNVRTARVN
jgi:hypothetical protein